MLRQLLLLQAFIAPFAASSARATESEIAGAMADHSFFVAVKSLDLRAILPPPPARGSIGEQADIDGILQLQSQRTAAQAKDALAATGDTLFRHDDVLGSWFTRENLPLTEMFINQAFSDAYDIFLAANALYTRERPSKVEPRIKPALAVPGTNSYPSAHAWQAWFWADLLSEIYPEKRAELQERARVHAWLRVVAGLHYPTDVTASRVVANATVAEMLKLPAVRTAIRTARSEAEPFLRRAAAKR